MAWGVGRATLLRWALLTRFSACRIFLATHHVDGLVGGPFDSELTAKGLDDAGRIAAALAERIGVGASRSLVSSGLRRTAQTATVIGDILDIAPDLGSRLQEKSYGVAEGREQSWLGERFVPPPAVGNRLRPHEGIDGAETRLEVASRVYEATSDALARDVDDLVIVTHGYAAYVRGRGVDRDADRGRRPRRLPRALGQHHDAARGRLLPQPRRPGGGRDVAPATLTDAGRTVDPPDDQRSATMRPASRDQDDAHRRR